MFLGAETLRFNVLFERKGFCLFSEKVLCVSGPDQLCGASVITSDDELPVPQASEHQVSHRSPAPSVCR